MLAESMPNEPRYEYAAVGNEQPCPIGYCSMRYSGPNRCQLFVDHCAPTMEHNRDHSSRSLRLAYSRGLPEESDHHSIVVAR